MIIYLCSNALFVKETGSSCPVEKLPNSQTEQLLLSSSKINKTLDILTMFHIYFRGVNRQSFTFRFKVLFDDAISHSKAIMLRRLVTLLPIQELDKKIARNSNGGSFRMPRNI